MHVSVRSAERVVDSPCHEPDCARRRVGRDSENLVSVSYAAQRCGESMDSLAGSSSGLGTPGDVSRRRRRAMGMSDVPLGGFES